MNFYKYRLLTIVTETLLESRLVETIESLGAQGYTITDVRGKGKRGVRNAGWEANANIRLEIVCSESVAEKIASYLKEHYYDDFAMILFASDVDVLRADKF